MQTSKVESEESLKANWRQGVVKRQAGIYGTEMIKDMKGRSFKNNMRAKRGPIRKGGTQLAPCRSTLQSQQ